MAETMASDSSVPPSPRLSHFRMTPRSWGLWTGRLFVLLVVGIGCYTLGRHSSNHEFDDYKKKYGQLQNDNQKLTADNSNQSQQIDALQAKVKTVQDQLDAISRPNRTLAIDANEAVMVSSGHFTVGMVGSPSSERVNININGKQQSVAAGDVIGLSTTCRVQLTSFENLKAIINVSCAAVNQ